MILDLGKFILCFLDVGVEIAEFLLDALDFSMALLNAILRSLDGILIYSNKLSQTSTPNRRTVDGNSTSSAVLT